MTYRTLGGKNVVAAGLAERCRCSLLMQWCGRTISVNVEPLALELWDEQIAKAIAKGFDLPPTRDYHELDLLRPIYQQLTLMAIWP